MCVCTAHGRYIRIKYIINVCVSCIFWVVLRIIEFKFSEVSEVNENLNIVDYVKVMEKLLFSQVQFTGTI